MSENQNNDLFEEEQEDDGCDCSTPGWVLAVQAICTTIVLLSIVGCVVVQSAGWPS